MLIGIGASIYSGTRYDAAISSANLAARFDAALGITSSGGFASAWADQSGNGRNLLQATGANQPIHLPFAGTKYGYLPGVAGNYFSTPDSVANSITGDIDIRCEYSGDWTPSAVTVWGGKFLNSGQYSWRVYTDTSGTKWHFQYSIDGTAAPEVSVTATAPFADNVVGWWRVTRESVTGYVNFYTSPDGVAWTPLGTQQTGSAGALYNGTDPVQFGTSAFPLSGQIYRAQIYNGIDGTLAADFDPSRWTSGTTFTAATGETWTINSTGSKPAQIVDRPSLLFDGSAHYIKTDPFTLNQPETVYLVAKQVSWTLNDVIFDGGSLNTLTVYQNATTPKIRCYAGAVGNENSNLAIGTTGVICLVMNGASSILRINNTTEVTGNFGALNAGGFTLGAAGDVGASAPSNIQAYEVLIYNVAHDAATRSNIIRALMSKHGVA